MNDLTQSMVMFLVGGIALRLSLTEHYLRYVKGGLRPFLIAAGVVLVVAALVTIIRDLRSEPSEADHEEHRDGASPDGHHHAHHGPRVAWLLILPVAAILLIAPPALGSYSANRSASAAVQEQSEFPDLPAGDPVAMSNIDYATRAIWDKGESMKGRTIRLTGFLTPRPAGGFFLTRIMLSCCAADGRPIKIGLEGDLLSDLKPDDWIQADGEYTARVDRNERTREMIVFIKVTDHQRVSAPDMPYE